MHHRRDHHHEDYKRRENYQSYPVLQHESAATKRKRSPSYSGDNRHYYSQSSYEKNTRLRRSSPPPSYDTRYASYEKNQRPKSPSPPPSYDTRYPAENRDREVFRKDNRGPPPHRREGGGGSDSIGEKVNYTGKTVHDVLGTIASASRTQEGSRFIQRSIEEGTDETRRLIFEELEPSFLSLMTDNFGNYVLQKMVDAATADQIAAVVPRMKDHILKLSENGKSNYVIQKIIQFVCKQVGNNSLSEEIEGTYRDFLHDVSDSLQGKLKDLCCHQIGTRVVQSLIAYFPENLKDRLLKQLVLSFDDLAVNYYGSYVLNDALKCFQEELVDNLADKVHSRVVEYSQDQYASIFVKSFLDNPKYRSNICWKFINTCFRQAGSRKDNYQESSLECLLNNGIGLSMLRKVVDVCEEEQTNIIEQYVELNREEIIRTKFGGEFVAAVRGGRKGGRSNYISLPPPPASVPQHDARGKSRIRDRDGGGAGEWSRRDEGRYEPRFSSLPPTHRRSRSRSRTGSPVQHRGDGRSDYYYAGYEKNQRPRSPSPPPSYDTRYPAENRDREVFRKDNRGPPPHQGGGGSGFRSAWQCLCDKINSVWSSYDSDFLECPNDQWYLIPVKKLYIRPCYRSTLKEVLQKRDLMNKLKVAFIGTSGIGKSGFLQTLLIYLVHEANCQDMVYTIRLKVLTSERSQPKDWLLKTSGDCRHYDEEDVDYYLSDSVDISTPDLSNVKVACMLATSEKSTESKQFQKLPERMLIPMPVWTFDELVQISRFSDAENEIRYAVFGGSARNFLGLGSDLPVSESFHYIKETVDWFFEEERTTKVLSEEKWNKICTYLEECLFSSNNKERDTTSIAVKALMWHTDNCREFFYASRFMALLAQHILSHHENSLKEALKAIVGGSGVGYCFEYTGHKEMLSGDHKFEVKGKGQENPGFPWHFSKLKLQKFRRPEDIRNLTLGSYGLPYRSNFPLTDAVIQPDTLINFTIAKVHKGANVELEKLRGYLREADRNKHKFIWVVEDPGFAK